MPIVIRQPGPDPALVASPDDEPSIGDSASPGDLLPSGGAIATAPALAPHRALALDALHVLGGLRHLPRDAGLWGEPAFAREVELVRGHLGPIRSRRGLASSFGREAACARGIDRSDGSAMRRPLRVAYALRWLELGDGVARRGWTELVAAPD